MRNHVRGSIALGRLRPTAVVYDKKLGYFILISRVSIEFKTIFYFLY